MDKIDAINIQFPPDNRVPFLEELSEKNIKNRRSHIIAGKNKIKFSGKMDFRYVNIEIILKDENYLESLQHALRYNKINAETIKKRSDDLSIKAIDHSVLSNISNAIVNEIIDNLQYNIADYFIEPILFHLVPYEKDIKNFYESLKDYGFSEFSIKRAEGEYRVIDTFLEMIFEISNKNLREFGDIFGDKYLSGLDLIEFSNLSKSVENNGHYLYIAGQNPGDAIRKSIKVHKSYFELFCEKK